MENLDHDSNKNVSLSLIAEYGGSDSDSDDTETRSNDHTGNDDSDAAELSEMVLKNNLINACAHGPLSRSSVLDDVETTRHMIIDSCESGVVEYEVTEYRDVESDSDSSQSSDSSDSDVDSVKDIEEISSGDEIETNKTEKKPKVHEELGLDDLPPIEDLAISLPAQDTITIGTIASVVDRLVIVRAFPDTPAVDLESVLFLEKGAVALGKVFDVFGPVTEPHYCVRFNSVEHVKSRGAQPGMDVYIAPQSPHTNYVFLSELMKLKGSDASWLHDAEPPPQQVEFSDDEEERRVNKARKKQNRPQKADAPDGETSKMQAPQNTDSASRRRPADFSSRFGNVSNRNSRRSATMMNPTQRTDATKFQRSGKTCIEKGCSPQRKSNSTHNAYHQNYPLMATASFNPSMPPPFMGPVYSMAGHPQMASSVTGHMGSPMPLMMPPFRQNVPMFAGPFCNIPAQHPHWANNGQPPPPGT